MPLADRAANMGALSPVQQKLWDLMRDEAAAADRELTDA